MTLNDIVKAYIDFLKTDPNTSLELGFTNHKPELPTITSEQLEHKKRTFENFRHKLANLDNKNLSFDEAIDHKLLSLQVEKDILDLTVTIDGQLQVHKMPLASETISRGIFLLFVNDPREAGVRLDEITGRLRDVPHFLKDYQNTIKLPVARWCQMDLEQARELPDLFDNILSWAKELQYPRLDDLQAATDKSKAALTRWVEHLSQIEKTKNIHIGAEQTKKIVAARGINLSLEKIHTIACNFLKQNQKDVQTLAAKLKVKYQLDASTTVEDIQTFLNEKFKVKAKGQLNEKAPYQFILEKYKRENQQILDFIGNDQLFPVMDDQKMQIIQTPAFLAPTIPAGAMLPPLPFRKGTLKSIVYLTLSQELMDEHTEISIPAMMVHEGIPGHHLQFCWANKNPSPLRKLLSFNDLSEGWTTMLEDYMLDRGYKSELKDEIRFITKRDMARLGARVAIDLFFMSGDKKYLQVGVDVDHSGDESDPFKLAGALLQKVTGFTEARVQAELNWYSQERGYPLSYLVGNHLVWELKADFLEKQKSKQVDSTELDKLFHEVFLKAGNMPVHYLREVFDQKNLI